MKRAVSLLTALLLTVCLAMPAMADGWGDLFGGLGELFRTEEKTEEDLFAGETVTVKVAGRNVKVHRAFKEWMDDYEDFFEEAAKDLDKSFVSPLEELKLLQKYQELCETLDKFQEADLSGGDYAYYMDVMTRISVMLEDVS